MAASSPTTCPTITTEVPMRGSVLTPRVAWDDACDGWQQQRWQWQAYRRSQSRRKRQVTWKCPARRNKYWQDRKCTTCGWIWDPQGIEPRRAEAPTEVRDTEKVGRSHIGLGPGTTKQSKETPGSRGGTVDGGAAIDGRSKNRDDNGGQASERGPTACSPRHFDLCRCRSTDTSTASPAPATDPRRGHPRSAHEDDRCANEHTSSATGSAPRTSANYANGADSHSGIGTFPRAASHAGNRTSRSNAAGRGYCSRKKPAKCRHTSGKTLIFHKRRGTRRTGERPWRTVDGDQRRAPEQIHPGSEQQICSLLKKGQTLLKRDRETQMRGELRRQNEIPGKWRTNRRWKETPECRIGEAKKPGPPDKLKPCPHSGEQCQLQSRKGKCAICETMTTTVWKCSTCSDSTRRRGSLMCEECLKYEAPVKGAAVTEKRKREERWFQRSHKRHADNENRRH